MVIKACVANGDIPAEPALVTLPVDKAGQHDARNVADTLGETDLALRQWGRQLLGAGHGLAVHRLTLLRLGMAKNLRIRRLCAGELFDGVSMKTVDNQ